MRRYELAESSSSKFWEAGTEGSVLTVRFGRIGSAGQSKSKDFPDAEAARRECERLVREKTAKGYRLVEGADPQALQAPSPSNEPANDTGTTPPATPRSEKLFAGTPLPTRTRPGPPLSAADEWSAFAERVRPMLGAAPEGARMQAETLAIRLDHEPAALDAGEARALVDALFAACPAMDQRGWGEKPGPHGAAARAAFAHLARWLAARAAAGTLAALLDRLRPRPMGTYGTMPPSVWDIPSAPGLRAGLVAASEAEYEAAIAAGEALYAGGRDPHLGIWLAFVLADDRPAAAHDLRPAIMLERHGDPDRAYGHGHAAVPLIVDLPPSLAAPWWAKPFHKATLATCDVTSAEAAATAIAVAGAAGEPATASLAWLLRDAVGPERTLVARALLDTRAEDALPALLPFVGAKLVRDALDSADIAFPDWMLRAYLGAMEGRGEAAYGPRAVALAGRHGPETAQAWAAEGGAKLSGRLGRLVADDVPAAPREAWPPMLRDPPWRRKARARGRIELTLAPIPTPLRHGFDEAQAFDRDTFLYRIGHVVGSMAELAAEIRATEAEAKHDLPIPPPAEPVPAADAPPEAALAWLERRLDMEREAFTGFFYFNYGPWLQGIGWQPDPLALMLWEKTGPLIGSYCFRHQLVAAMVLRFGERAIPALARLVAAEPSYGMALIETVDAAGIAPVAARIFVRTKRMRPAAIAWLTAHRRTATMRLLPVALGPAGSERDVADATLRFLAAAPGGRAALDEALAAYTALDPRVPEAAASGVDGDPFEQVPAKVPKLPDWIVPAALPRPVLDAGGALPDEAVTALCEMLAFSDPLAPYAGIAQLRGSCTAASLDAFATALFEAWVAAGANTAGEWTMRALAQIGGDEGARSLTRQIRAWGQAGLRPRGKSGIAVLAGIGTDLALMNLSAIAEKNPLLQLREAARAAIAEAAAARGLDEVELADRLSPDLGLDARGGLELSFGERRFRVGFDETLKPWLSDAEGRRLPSLPRPTKADDAEAAKAASKLWAGLKKDAEAAARLQVSRLETMLANQRRVAPDIFWPFFAAHPLIRHLAGRLVWGLYPDARPASRPELVFRLAEDLSLTDAQDGEIALDLASAEGAVGLVHPLHLEDGARAAWTALFADYEIAQPFAQLARETYAFTEAERDAAETGRFEGVRVAGRRLRGLRAQGWSTDDAGEQIHDLRRPVALPDGADLFAVLPFADGLWHRPGPEGDGIQTLGRLRLSESGWTASTSRRFGDLDPVTASEVLRVPSLLAATGGD